MTERTETTKDAIKKTNALRLLASLTAKKMVLANHSAAFELVLCRDRIPVAVVSNDGHGGCHDWRPAPGTNFDKYDAVASFSAIMADHGGARVSAGALASSELAALLVAAGYGVDAGVAKHADANRIDLPRHYFAKHLGLTLDYGERWPEIEAPTVHVNHAVVITTTGGGYRCWSEDLGVMPPGAFDVHGEPMSLECEAEMVRAWENA